MTHDENRISDLIDGGLHDKSAIDRAKYELHLRRIAAIEEAAKNDTGGWYEQQAFIRGAQHVIEHPERYGLITQDKALQASRPVIERLNERRRRVEAAREEAGELRRILGIIHNITTDDRVHKLAGKAIGWEDKK